MQWAVKSVGDKVPYGKFEIIDSRFENTVNFVYQNYLISVVTDKIGAGPHNIVLENYDLQELVSLEIGPGVRCQKIGVRCQVSGVSGEREIEIGEDLIYNSELQEADFELRMVEENLHLLEEYILQNYPDKGLLFLYQEKEAIFDDQNITFDNYLRANMQEAFLFLKTGQIAKAVVEFRGKGYGLTPSGDDFLVGLMLGLTFREKILKNKFTKIKAIIYAGLLSKRYLTNTFLLQAFQGWYNQPWKNILISLGGKQPGMIYKCADEVIGIGSTSGADLMAGFISGVRYQVSGVSGEREESLFQI